MAMSNQPYLTAPVKSATLPRGIPYIVGNEAAERFSYYGMNSILIIFMTRYLVDAAGKPDLMDEQTAKIWFHNFTAAAYFFPLIGAFIADAFLGKYRTILTLSIVYCLGHGALALNETRAGLFVGLTLLAIGAGGIKPCVSAHVGDQFGASNQHLLSRVFSWFYFSINFGAMISTILIPELLHSKNYGSRWAFGVPGIAMLIATIVFWMGRRKFVHIPPAGKQFVGEMLRWGNLKYVMKLLPVYAFVAIFWALYEQTFSAWTLQATRMDLTWLGRTWKPEQIQTLNPILILLFIPLFSYVIYPWINRFFTLTPLRKMGIGFFVAIGSFLVPAWVAKLIEGGATPPISWHGLAYIIITAAEVMVSITSLEFSYTQAPKKMKSIVMGIYLLSVTAGNLLTSFFNWLIRKQDGTSHLTEFQYFMFFAGLMSVAAVLFVFLALKYREETIVQDEAPVPAVA
jgi:POT family proton-dependent oligopeptide transporter